MKNFIALDFETANPKRNSMCSIGIVKVVEGVFVEKLHMLVQPPNNEYYDKNIEIHGINPDLTKHCLTFDLIYPNIKHYFINQTIVCHNADFDIDVLHQTLEYYNIDIEYDYKVACTCKLNQGKKLDLCCQEYSIDLDHHDALGDAEACAKLFLKINGIEHLQISKFKNKFEKIGYQGKILSHDVKVPPVLENIENKDNIFYNKKVVITGDFNNIDLKREEIALKIKELGGDINTSVSKKTNIVIIGTDFGPRKMETIKELQLQGYDIQLIYENELINLLKI